jgi:hypothetical protein
MDSRSQCITFGGSGYTGGTTRRSVEGCLRLLPHSRQNLERDKKARVNCALSSRTVRPADAVGHVLGHVLAPDLQNSTLGSEQFLSTRGHHDQCSRLRAACRRSRTFSCKVSLKWLAFASHRSDSVVVYVQLYTSQNQVIT